MIYPENYEQKVGFDRIRHMLQERCLGTLGRALVSDMTFMTAHAAVMEELHRCDEMMRIVAGEGEFPTDYYYDVRPILRRTRIEGSFIEVHELYDLRRSLETIRRIVAFFHTDPDEQPAYPHLAALAGEVTTYPQLTAAIDNILDKNGNVKDSASPALREIRRTIASTVAGLSQMLNSILRHAQAEGYVDRDVAPSMRDGRLVIPVAPAYKRKIRGIVHDESASGKTVYIEPAEVVEANNRVRELEIEERHEIVRILTEFTTTLRPHAQEIAASYDFLAQIDFVRAKALFSLEIDARLPHVEDVCQIEWYHAIHPLLMLALQKQGKQPVPLEIRLDARQRILLISGPNAGGKSVCLKTVGLLQYMMQCGVPVPMYDNSHMGIFDKIFIDIGDEQSIENDLSTYSSHLAHMKQCVRHCDERSLLLIDEFGGGTEPQIGGAIAEALLDAFNRRRAFGVITTHYQNLKKYAEDTPGVVNGAMLYDRHHMQPLFSLSIGNPGSSFAIEIARKTGLPEEVIARASEIVGQEYISMDKYLQDIVRDKRYWENKRQNIRLKEKQIEELTERYTRNLDRIDRERKELIAQAKEEARRLLAESNARIENTIRSIKEAQADKEATREARRKLQEYKQMIEEQDATAGDRIEREITKLKNRRKRKGEQAETPAAAPATPTRPIAVGDYVTLKGEKTVGEVIAVGTKEATVAFGVVQSKIKIERLERTSQQPRKSARRETSFISATTYDEMREKQLSFVGDIDVRGMRVDEALQAIAYFIDDAIQVSCSRVRILHGTGTGALRTAIRNYLKSVNGVAHYADEHIQLGGAGITVVDLE